MGVFVNLIFFVITFATLAVAGGFASNAAVRVTQIPAWEQNSSLKDAHNKLSIAAVVTWVTVAALVLAVVLYLIFGLETAETPGVLNIFIYLLLFGALAAVGVVGVLSAIAAVDIGKANVTDDKGARRQTIIATVLAIVGFVGILVVLMIRLFYKPEKKKKGGKKEGGEGKKEESKEARLEALIRSRLKQKGVEQRESREKTYEEFLEKLEKWFTELGDKPVKSVTE